MQNGLARPVEPPLRLTHRGRVAVLILLVLVAVAASAVLFATASHAAPGSTGTASGAVAGSTGAASRAAGLFDSAFGIPSG